MANISTKCVSFPVGNPWSISVGTSDVELSLRRLVHAAVTAGHNQGWRQSIVPSVAAQWELLWKTSALRVAVSERNTQPNWRPARMRLVPTDRFDRMDPSERRALSYHLGITLAVAWARKALGIPWLLHLDVYQNQYNANLRPGNSRPDLIGRHRNGSWAVFETKGRSSPPNADAEKKAKYQAGRIADIGGVVPTGCFAFFSYYTTDKTAVGRGKPRVIHIRVIDPPLSKIDDDAILLPKFTEPNFFRSYYEPWKNLLGPERKSVNREDDAFVWRDLRDLDFRVGMLRDVASALEAENHRDIPIKIKAAEERQQLAERYEDWAGDGLVIEPGETWKNLLVETKTNFQ
jgi:hypothetical protein